jgi:hypothetical protein
MKMILRKLVLGFVVLQGGASLFTGNSRDQSLDSDWRFLRGDHADPRLQGWHPLHPPRNLRGLPQGRMGIWPFPLLAG